jgi:hypothetical protein
LAHPFRGGLVGPQPVAAERCGRHASGVPQGMQDHSRGATSGA